MDWRNEIKKSVDHTNWFPAWGKQREHEWLNNMGDWMISKKRFWGLALPIWEFEDGSFYVVGSKEELKDLACEGWEEFEGNSPHRPWIDKVKIKHPKTGLIGTRVLDVGNPWLDAGIVGFSTLNHRTDKNYWDKWYPADLISESFPGQFRNWFYSYLTMGTALARDIPSPTKNIFSYALVKDENGAEMHKSQGNAIWFDDAAEDIGVDVIRWLYTRQNPEINLRFGPQIANEIRRQVIIPIWNIYSFFTNYAILDKFTPPTTLKEPKSANLMDTWILAELKETSESVKQNLKLYQPDKAALALENFINLLSNWYIRRNRRRFWKSGNFESGEIDSDKLSAYESLYFELVTLTKIMSPIIPFVTEEMYTNLTSYTSWAKESVHLESFPDFAKLSKNETELQVATRAAMKISSLARAARSKSKIKVRQPLNSLLFRSKEKISTTFLDMIKNQVSDEINVKKVAPASKNTQLSNVIIKPNNATLGPKIGNKLGLINKEISTLDQNKLYKDLQKNKQVILSEIEIKIEDLSIEHISLADSEFIEDNNYQVSIETKLNKQLIEEGITREIIHSIQNLRKDSGFNISDKISVTYSGDTEVTNVINKNRTHISEEILATKLEEISNSDTNTKNLKINNFNIDISIKLS